MSTFCYGKYSSLLVEYLSCFKISIIIYDAANGIMGLKGMLILKAQKLPTCFPKGLNQFRPPTEIYEQAHFRAPSPTPTPLEETNSKSKTMYNTPPSFHFFDYLSVREKYFPISFNSFLVNELVISSSLLIHLHGSWCF